MVIEDIEDYIRHWVSVHYQGGVVTYGQVILGVADDKGENMYLLFKGGENLTEPIPFGTEVKFIP